MNDKNDGCENIHNFTVKLFVYLDLYSWSISGGY